MGPEELPLQGLLSDARYSRYLDAAGGDADRAARLYEWNCRLSAAYWPSISLVEVAVRNAINAHLCAYFNLSPDVGWHTEAMCDRPRIHLLEKEKDKLRKAIEAFHRGRGTHGTGPPTGDDVVAGTSLGLWVALCGEGIPRRKYDYHRLIWRGMSLHKAFPNYGNWLSANEPRKNNPADNPGPLRRMLRDFELLRNRIAHHEPIYTLKPSHHVVNIETLAGLVEERLTQYIKHTSRVAGVVTGYKSYVLGQT